MSLGRILDAVGARLTAALGAGVTVGDSVPSSVGDLPTVTLAILAAERQLIGVGAIPRGTQRGALALAVTVDLAHPVLDLGGGETLSLLSTDRRVVTLPHGPVVRADGTEQPPFGAGDVLVTDPNPFAVVAGPPTGREVQVDPVAGTMRFGIALPATGSVHTVYHVGQWDTVTTRYQGVLEVDVVATDVAATHQLSRDVGVAIDRLDSAVRLTATGWHRNEALAIGNATARHQLLEFRFDAEIEDPLLTSSGGVITDVAAALDLPDPLNVNPDESFDIR